MFDNISGRLKLVAKIVGIVGVIIYMAYGLYVLLEGPKFFFSGLFTMFGGSLRVLVYSWLLYSMGDILEVVYRILWYIKPAPTKENTDENDHAVQDAIDEWRAREKAKKEAQKK